MPRRGSWIPSSLNPYVSPCSIRKALSLCPDPFKGVTLRSESFRGFKGVGDQTTISWNALLPHHPVPTRRRHHHEKNKHKGSWGTKVSISCTLQNPSFRRALWSGQFWALLFGMTLQYGGHDCFLSEVPFGGRYIPFGMHHHKGVFFYWMIYERAEIQSSTTAPHWSNRITAGTY